MAEYEDGTIVVVYTEFTHPDTGVAVDPTTVRMIARTPDGVSTTYTYGVDVALEQSSAGHYQINFNTTDELGTWIYRWECSGTYTGAREGTFYVY